MNTEKLKQLDQATVLEIIEMIKTRYEAYDDLYEKMKSEEYAGMCNALHELINHFESFIEETEFPDPKSACSACGSYNPDHLCQL